jgi:uncharacterized membrane protein YccF (DUF307 family)
VSTIGNILWLIFVGIWLAIAFVVAGIVMFLLIITGGLATWGNPVENPPTSRNT